MRWPPLLALALSLAACVDQPAEHRVRANALLRAGKAAEALSEVEQGLKKKPKDVPLLIMWGKTLFELDRLDEARQAYQAALDAGKELKPTELTEAHLGLAVIAVRAKQPDVARLHFARLVELHERNVDHRLNLARVCLQTGDMKCALEHGEAAGRLRGSSEAVLFTLGRIYTVAKKYPEAEKTFEHICEVVPGASSCPYGVALVAAQQGDKTKALAKLREAMDRKLPNPDKIADDPLLAPLKDDEAFKKLVSQGK